jgi:biotin operon repressor
MIDTGEVKNQAALSRKLDISRARVSQVLSILQLDKNLIEAVEQLGNTMPAQIRGN